MIYRYIEKYLKGKNKKFVIRTEGKESELNRENINKEKLQSNMKYIYENYNIIEEQSFEEKLREKIIIGLRMEKGIVLEQEIIENTEIYDVILKYIRLKFLKEYIGEDFKKYICLTEEGKNCANIIWQELV